jgi:hypothetical protein
MEYKQWCVLCVMVLNVYAPIDSSSIRWYENPLFAVYCIFGWLLISGLGSMLHFTYQWTNCNWVVGLFVAVNESVFEHMKILSLPVFLFWLISFVIYSSFIDTNTYECMMKHVVSANAAIYSGVFVMGFFHLVVSVGVGFEPLAFDIFLFCMSAFVAQCVGFYCLNNMNYIVIAVGASIYSGVFFSGGVYLIKSVVIRQNNSFIGNSTEAGISHRNNSFIGNSTEAGTPPGSDVDMWWIDVILFVVFVCLAMCIYIRPVSKMSSSFLRFISSICFISACFFHMFFTDYPPKFMPVLFRDIKGEFYGRPSNCTLLDGFTPRRIVYNSSNSTSN